MTTERATPKHSESALAGRPGTGSHPDQQPLSYVLGPTMHLLRSYARRSGGSLAGRRRLTPRQRLYGRRIDIGALYVAEMDVEIALQGRVDLWTRTELLPRLVGTEREREQLSRQLLLFGYLLEDSDT